VILIEEKQIRLEDTMATPAASTVGPLRRGLGRAPLVPGKGPSVPRTHSIRLSLPQDAVSSPRSTVNLPQAAVSSPQAIADLPRATFNLPQAKLNPDEGGLNPERGGLNPERGRLNREQGRLNPERGILALQRRSCRRKVSMPSRGRRCILGDDQAKAPLGRRLCVREAFPAHASG
jgi:hypothetical protein